MKTNSDRENERDWERISDGELLQHSFTMIIRLFFVFNEINALLRM